MGDHAKHLDDAAFQRLLAARSRWRWSFSTVIVGAYFCFALLGIYNKAFYASPFAGSAMPWGLVMGLSIILASIISAISYVRIVNRIESSYKASSEHSS